MAARRDARTVNGPFEGMRGRWRCVGREGSTRFVRDKWELAWRRGVEGSGRGTVKGCWGMRRKGMERVMNCLGEGVGWGGVGLEAVGWGGLDGEGWGGECVWEWREGRVVSYLCCGDSRRSKPESSRRTMAARIVGWLSVAVVVVGLGWFPF